MNMHMTRLPATALALLMPIMISSSFAYGQATFQGMGDLPGGPYNSEAHGVSADGAIVVGRGYTVAGGEGTYWVSVCGLESFGDLALGGVNCGGRAISADGTTIVGIGSSALGFEAFRWTIGGGITGLGFLSSLGSPKSYAHGVSADGAVVVGFSTYSSGVEFEAFHWTSGGTSGSMVGLGDLLGGSVNSRAQDVSDDGLVVVGRSDGASGIEAFRWTIGDGMVGLGDLSGGGFFSVAYGISADGEVVVGKGESASGPEAFRWTSGGGMIGLGDLPGGAFSSDAKAASADGSIVVGTGDKDFLPEAFIWDATNGMQHLQTLLVTDFGLDLTGWILFEATDISDDGTIIVGFGINPDSLLEGWKVTIPNLVPPCPTDTNGDGNVNVTDLLALLAAWGPCP